MQEIPVSAQSKINSINRELRGLTTLARKRSVRTGGVVKGRRKPMKRAVRSLTQMTQSPKGRRETASCSYLIGKGLFGGPDRNRTDDLFHAMMWVGT